MVSLRIVLVAVGFLGVFQFSGFSQDPIKILDEKVRIAFNGAKPGFCQVSYSSEVVYKILTQSGADSMRHFLLPEPLEYVYRDISPEHRKSPHYIDEIKIEEFKAEIRSGFDRWVERTPDVEYNWVPTISFWSDYYGKALHTIYKLPKLEVGDEVKVTYKWSAPFFRNLPFFGSMRLYHHGRYEKEKSELALEYHQEMGINIVYQNGDTPHKVNMLENKRQEEVWKYYNLPGALNETNSRPYENLPHTDVSPFNYHRVTRYFNQRNHFGGIGLSINIGSKSKQYALLREFITDTVFTQSDTWSRFVDIQNNIATEFNYKSDTAAFLREIIRDNSIGVDFSEGVLRDINRYPAYAAMLYLHNIPFLLGYAADKRTSEYTASYVRPAYTSDVIFVFPDANNQLQFLLPKSTKGGYFINELPFYLENTSMKVVQPRYFTQAIEYEGFSKNGIIATPSSNMDENQRKVQVKVDLVDTNWLFDTEMELKGQFSTLMRHFYETGQRDVSVSNRYYKPIWKFDSEASLKNESGKLLSTVFPYTYEYTSESFVSNQVKETQSVPLGQWIHHPFPLDFDSAVRTLDFYPDFLFQDDWSIELKLPEKYKVSKLPEIQYVDNDFGFYQFIVRENDGKVTVKSELHIKAESVNLEKIEDVTEIVEAIKAAKKSLLLIEF